jgi:hypothetical protein
MGDEFYTAEMLEMLMYLECDRVGTMRFCEIIASAYAKTS